jgi:hypothetical protein
MKESESEDFTPAAVTSFEVRKSFHALDEFVAVPRVQKPIGGSI